MSDSIPNPVGFQEAIERSAPFIERTDHIIVEIADTDENATRISTIATTFEVTVAKVEQAIVQEIEYQLTQPDPDAELTDHLVHEHLNELRNTGP